MRAGPAVITVWQGRFCDRSTFTVQQNCKILMLAYTFLKVLVYAVFLLTMLFLQAIDLAKILWEQDAIIPDCPPNPYLANFYLIKIRSSQSIIPTWEGGIKR